MTRGEGLHFCIKFTELGSDRIVQIIFVFTKKLVGYLVDNREVSDNLQDKTKRLLSLEKFMQIKTNPKVWSNPKRLSYFMKSSNVSMVANLLCKTCHFNTNSDLVSCTEL